MGAEPASGLIRGLEVTIPGSIVFLQQFIDSLLFLRRRVLWKTRPPRAGTHQFVEKSKKGIKTPPAELEVVRKRLNAAKEDYEERRAEENKSGEQGHH
jgi:hypothetical protein